MGKLFLTVLNMSLTASYVIIFVILVRIPLKKAPKIISYALWSVVAFRLMVPFSFESMFSLMPRNTGAAYISHDVIDYFSQDIIYQQSPKINGGIEAVDCANHLLPLPTAGASGNQLQIYVEIGAYLWLLGMIALIAYGIVSAIVLKRQLKGAQLIEENIYEAENLKTPFVLGLIKPKIYLPVGLNNEERNFILLHERIHINRKDNIIKISAFFILTVHWFNPLVWIAFSLMSTDMELSCDERVMKEMTGDIKKPYACLLLSLAAGKRIPNGCPLAFGEGDVKERIKNVLSYKKPKYWVTALTVIIISAVGIGLIVNPSESRQNTSGEHNPSLGQLRLAEELKQAKNGLLDNKIGKFVEDNLAIIMSSPSQASDAHTYIQAHQQEYENIKKIGGEKALQYMLYQFEIGNAEGLRGYIMMYLCKDLLGARNNVTDETLIPQEWYNALSIRQEVMLPDFEYDGDDPVEKLVYATEIQMNSQPQRGFTIVAPKIFGSYEEGNMLKVFVTTFSATYKLYGNVLELKGGSIVPAAITYKKDDNGNYVLEKYEQAQDGADWAPSINEFCTMPVSGKKIRGLADKIIKHYSNRDDINTLQWNNLAKHLKANGVKEAILFNPYGEVEFSMSVPEYME